MAETLKRYCRTDGLGIGDIRLLRHTIFHTRRGRKRICKPNPYTTREVIEREELLDANPLTGHEERPGMMDLRPLVLERDGYQCRLCGATVTTSSCEVDHIRPIRFFKRPVDANFLENLWTLCIPCHLEKTAEDRPAESRMH